MKFMLQRNILITLIFKILATLFFSSGVQVQLFRPFVNFFTEHWDNPWNHFLSTQPDAFPYPPLMLYLLIVPELLSSLFANILILKNLFYNLPILGADVLIFWVVLQIFPNRKKEVYFIYFLSPVILFSSYFHSQLDLVPIAFSLTAVYFLLNQRPLISALFFGFALSTKFNTILLMPLIGIYLWKKNDWKSLMQIYCVSFTIYLLIASPFLFSEGYFHMVLNNPKQNIIWDTFYRIGDLKIYIPILSLFIVLTRLAAYKKINQDLFYSFLAITFSIFVFFVKPEVGWYVWVVPFFSVVFIKFAKDNFKIWILNYALSVTYLLYFLFAHQSQYPTLIFLSQTIDLSTSNIVFQNFLFTILEAILIVTIYYIYKISVRSNSVYRFANPIVIGLGGDSGAGKTTFLKNIRSFFKDNILEIESDGYHKWARHDQNWKAFTHLDPKANHIHQLSSNIHLLKQGKSIFQREYLHSTGKFSEPKTVMPKDFIVISGLHPFYLPIMRRNIDLKIFLAPSPELRTHWKIKRDVQKRGYKKEDVIKQLEKRASDTEKHIEPQRQFADIVFEIKPKHSFELGEEIDPEIYVEATFGADLNFDDILSLWIEKQLFVKQDYSEDLHKQTLSFENTIPAEVLIYTAKKVIPNLEELTQNFEFNDGFPGIMQFCFLYALSEKMKDMVNYEI